MHNWYLTKCNWAINHLLGNLFIFWYKYVKYSTVQWIARNWVWLVVRLSAKLSHLVVLLRLVRTPGLPRLRDYWELVRKHFASQRQWLLSNATCVSQKMKSKHITIVKLLLLFKFQWVGLDSTFLSWLRSRLVYIMLLNLPNILFSNSFFILPIIPIFILI